MIHDDWVNIESSNLYEKIKPHTLDIRKLPEIQRMTVDNKSPPESYHNGITHRNVNTVNSIPEDIIDYNDMMIPKTISSQHERGINDCFMSLKEYVREAKVFLIKCSHYVDYWDDIV